MKKGDPMLRKRPPEVTAKDGQAAYVRVKEYLDYQGLDLERPLPPGIGEGSEYILDLVTKHHKLCTREVFEDAVIIDKWLEYQMWTYVIAPHEKRRAAFLDACQYGKDRGDAPSVLRERERLSYAKLGDLYGFTRTGMEQYHLRLRASVAHQVRDPKLARTEQPKKPRRRRG